MNTAGQASFINRQGKHAAKVLPVIPKRMQRNQAVKDAIDSVVYNFILGMGYSRSNSGTL